MSIARKLMTQGKVPVTPPPVDGLPTLILTDFSAGEAPDDTMQTFDVSDVSNGNISYRASIVSADIGDRRLKGMIVDTDSNYAFACADTLNSDAPLFTLDLSNPNDSSGWVAAYLDVDPASSKSFDRMAYDKTKKRLFISDDKKIYCCDVSNPLNVTVLGSYDPPLSIDSGIALDPVHDVILYGYYSEYISIDVSDPANMATLGQGDLVDYDPFNSGVVADPDRNLFFVGGSTDGLWMVDTSDPVNMVVTQLLTGDVIVPNQMTFDKSSNLLITNTEWDSDGLRIHAIDVSDLANITFTEIDPGAEPTRMALDTTKKVVYVPMADTNKEVRAYDYSSGTLVEIATFETTMVCEFSALSAV